MCVGDNLVELTHQSRSRRPPALFCSGLPYTAFFGSASIVIQRSEPVFRELFGENSVRALEQKVQATVEQFMYTSAFRHLFAKKMAFLVKGPKE